MSITFIWTEYAWEGFSRLQHALLVTRQYRWCECIHPLRMYRSASLAVGDVQEVGDVHYKICVRLVDW